MNRLLLLLVFCGACYAADSISVTSPTGNPTWTGWTGNNFTVSYSGADIALVCFQVDAYPAINPGPAGVISGNAGGFLAAGCENLPPFTFPVDTFQWLDGPHQVVATAYDILGNVVATSSPATFTIGNTWPVSCPGPPILSVSTSIATTSTWHDQVTATATISGDCVGDSFTYIWALQGVQQNYSQPTITFDTTSVLNGPVVVGLMILDTTNGLSYNQTAAEWSRTVTVSNTGGSLARTEVRLNAREMFLESGGGSGGNCDVATGTAGSCTLIPQLIQTDGTPASSPTFYYYATSPNSTTLGATISGTCTAGSTGTFCTGSSVTVTAAATGNTQVLVTGVTQSGSDGTAGSATYSFTSPSYTGLPSDGGRTLYILGGTNCIVGAYTVQSVTHTGSFSLTSPASPGSPLVNFTTGATSNCVWKLGPQRVGWAYTGLAAPQVVHDSNCGSILTAYVATGPCSSRWTASIFTPASQFAAQVYPVPYVQSYCNSGFNTVENGAISSSMVLTGTQTAFVTNTSAYLGTQTALISPCPSLRLILTLDSWSSPSPLLQLEFGSASSTNWPGGGSSMVPSGVAGGAGTMNYLAKQTALVVKMILNDEITAQGWPGAMPLAGPIKPGASTLQNWLNNIVASSGGTCTATTYTSPIPSGGYGLGSTFIITGSATANMNSVYPALYTVNAINATSFSFTCTGVANGTYNSSTDPGLTIQQYGKYGWIVNNLTSTESYMNWDAWASYVNQMRSIPGGHVPVGGSYQGESPFWAVACFGKSVSGCGQSINTANTGGNTVSNLSDINDADDTHGSIEQYLRARLSLNAIVSDYFNASLEQGLRFRGFVDILDPLTSNTYIGQGLSTDYTSNGGANQYTVVSCVGNTIISAPHNITNIQPGTSRLWITGSTDPNCNNNFYIIAAPTSTTLSVVYAATQTTCVANGSGSCAYHNASAATLTFANGDKIGVGATLKTNAGNFVPMYEISADGLTKVMGSGSTVFNYGISTIPNDGCIVFGNPADASPAVTKDRGQLFTVKGVSTGNPTIDAYFNGTTFYYDIENLSTPTDEGGSPSGCFNFFREVPVLSGTGGTAQIVPDNLHVRGREEDSGPLGSDPDTTAMSLVECQILRCAGSRIYESETNPQSYNPVAVTDPLNGVLHKGGFASSNGAIFNPSWSVNNDQLGIHPNVESHYSVPDWKAASFINLMAERTGKFYLGSTPTNCPDYDPSMDACAFKNTAGNLLIVGNFTNGPQTRTVALCSDVRNLCTSGQSIIRYIADARGIYAVTVIAAGTMNDIGLTLQQGQAAWYTFPATFAGELNQPAPIPQLIPGSTGVAYRYAYDPYYLDSNPTGVFDCGSAATPCVLPIDLNIGQPGTHPYRVIYYKTVGGQKIVLNVGDIQYF